MDSTLSTRWRMLSQPRNWEPPPNGLDRVWLKASGWIKRFSLPLNRFLRQAERIQCEEKAYRSISDDKLCDLAAKLRNHYIRGCPTPETHHQAFALLSEIAARRVGMRPYREQIAGALAMHAGCVAEMATGEGKTLVATLPAVLAGWRGRGCHVITANDYLAKRDAGLMRDIYGFCGLTVGCVTGGMTSNERRQAYNAHVTYGTSKEIAADFLRDRLINTSSKGLPALILLKMAGGGEDRIGRLIQRGLEYAIIDEADSVLIDEASTPLLISGQGSNQEQIEAYKQAAQLAAVLNPSLDYRVSRDQSTVTLTTKGKQHLAGMTAALGGLWRGSLRSEELVVQALVADTVYRRDQHYVVLDNKVVIVDEKTGRLMPDRTWRDGLHQAIEAKEDLQINLPSETLARISFQKFFSLYGNLSGMSGTVTEAKSELWTIYQLPVIAIPTHHPCRRSSKPDRVFSTAAAKWRAVVSEIRRVHQTERPILIGTGSIMESERLSQRLTAEGLSHQVLNAVKAASEAEIIADAGQKGRITVATNMAGRGTDIRLGAGVAELSGLHVIATERFSAKRVDRQFSGRCARQGDPGSTQIFISLEDELYRKNTRMMAAVIGKLLCRKDIELTSVLWRRLFDALQKRVERIAFRLRKDVLSADSWLDHHLGFTDSEG